MIAVVNCKRIATGTKTEPDVLQLARPRSLPEELDEVARIVANYEVASDIWLGGTGAKRDGRHCGPSARRWCDPDYRLPAPALTMPWARRASRANSAS